jgi:hypothetical protein
VSVTVSDFTITFGATEDRGPGQMVNEDKVSVHLSPITAKILLENLAVIISSYEKVLGAIPLPPKVMDNIKSQIENLVNNLSDQMAPGQ